MLPSKGMDGLRHHDVGCYMAAMPESSDTLKQYVVQYYRDNEKEFGNYCSRTGYISIMEPKVKTAILERGI